MHALESQTKADEAFLRKWTFPEEDRHLFTTAPWNGGYRWFRSDNVVAIEQWPRQTSVKLRKGGWRRQAGTTEAPVQPDYSWKDEVPHEAADDAL